MKAPMQRKPGKVRKTPVAALLAAGLGALALAACGAEMEGGGAGESLDNALSLTVTSAATAADGRACVFDLAMRNATGAGALNVQAAWTAQTDGFGIVSDYQILGDFAEGEVRAARIAVTGAPCAAVRDLKLTRAVCAVAGTEPPESCAERVVLDGGGIVDIRRD